MSPDRGGGSDTAAATMPAQRRDEGVRLLPEGRHFTVRGVAVGLLVGLVICFSNMYFGLQTGWVSMMTMPASLLGFGIFRTLAPHLKFPFSPVENVLVQSVAGGMAIMPLGCGFVGVVSLCVHLSRRRRDALMSYLFRTTSCRLWSIFSVQRSKVPSF